MNTEINNENVMIIRDKKWSNKAINLYDVQIKIKKLKDKEEVLKNELVEASESTNSKYEGIEFKLVEKNGAIRYSQIPALKEMDLEPYRGKSYSYWRLYKKY